MDKYTRSVLLKCFSIVVLTCLLTACSSVKPYMVNRGRDAADSFTATVGRGYGGLKVKAGLVQGGLYLEGPCISFYGPKLCTTPTNGLRGGEWFDEDTKTKEFAGFKSNIDFQYFIYGMEVFGGGETAAERGKTRMALTILMITFPLPEGLFYRTKEPEDPNHKYSKFSPVPYFFDIELGFGLGYMIRIGFNLAEFLDFLVGLTTIDFLSDDIAE